MNKKSLYFFRLQVFMAIMTIVYSTKGQVPTTPNYTSKVPKFIFSDIIEEQRQQLKSNPLILRFNNSRQKFRVDRYRPLYHFVNPENTMNDPNGLCYWKGRWHLFYQGFPLEDSRVHWGHAVSKDLVHWEDLPYAIYPNPEEQVYSGTTLVESDRVIAMYHGRKEGNMVAVSNDPLLLNWEKLSGKAVIPIKSTTGLPLPYSVFDPSIWKKDSTYYSLSAGRKTKGPGGKPIAVNYLFRSKDLLNWEYMHEFVNDDRFTLIGDDAACPNFWPIGNKHILMFFSHMTGGQYLIGDYDKNLDRFNATNHGRFNFAAYNPSGVHAPSSTSDGEGGVIVMLNMNAGKPTAGWNQLMTLPRRLSLLKGDEIAIEPAGDIESLRYNHKHVKKVTLPANKEIVLQEIAGDAMELLLDIDVKKSPMVELNVLRSPDKEEYTSIKFFKDRGNGAGRGYFPGDKPLHAGRYSLISLETSYSSNLPDALSRAPETAPVLLNADETLKLRIFIDKSVVEVFVNGKQAIAARVYPGKENSLGVSLSSRGQDAELLSLDAWQMKSIYE